MPDTLRWREIATEARARLKRSIPREWQIAEDKLPPDSHLAVTHFPAECGILSPQELDITNQLAVDIVKRLATGEWTSEEVIIAFCKRASIAHQLVRQTLSYCECQNRRLSGDADELLDNDHV